MSSRESKHQFLELRSKLTSLNYTEAFTEDSSALVSRLLEDLITLTKAHSHVQVKEKRIAEDLSRAQAQLFPLRKENARLTRENHDLHNDTIRLNDEIRTSEEGYSRQMQILQEQLHDSRCQCEAQFDQLRLKSEMLDRLRLAYDTVVDPALKKGSAGAGSITHRSIKMSTKLSVGKGKANQSSPTSPTSRAFSSMDLALQNDSLVKSLRMKLSAANTEMIAKREECHRLSAAVNAREQELARTTKQITTTSGSMNMNANAGSLTEASFGMQSDQFAAADLANKRIINQLNGQVDFLNNELAKRESQLIAVNDKLMQYDTLKKELQERAQMLDQFRKKYTQVHGRMRALEQKLVESNNMCSQFSAVQDMMSNASDAGLT